MKIGATLWAYLHQAHSDHSEGILSLFRPIALACSWLYILVVQVRLLMYRWGLFSTRKLPSTVISIGNITLGGAGKTPAVAWIADLLHRRGCRVSVISRGYKRSGKGTVVVSDGHLTCPDWTRTGDEPFLLARKLPGVPVVVGGNRYAAGTLSVHRFHSDVLVLDDGFQHVRLHRDLDIVVIDASNPFGNGRLFPAGPLREPLSNLRRAGLFWITRVNQATDLSGLEQKLRSIRPQAPIVHSIHQPAGLYQIHGRAEVGLATIREAPVLLCSGIGNPRSFARTMAEMGATVVGHALFPDHHPYTRDDMDSVMASARTHGARYIVTTEKDAVRIPQDLKSDVPFLVLEIKMAVLQGREIIEAWLETETATSSFPPQN